MATSESGVLTIRPTQKLAKKLKREVDQSVPVQDNPLLDWHATLFTYSRGQYILFLNTATLYTAIAHGAGITNEDRFLKLFFSTVESQMRRDALREAYVDHVANAENGLLLARAANRSATGIMTEYVKVAKDELDEKSPGQVASLLNAMIWSPIDYKQPLECLRVAASRLDH